MALLCVMEICSRRCLSRWISNALDASFCVDAASEAVRFYGPAEMINTDLGLQYISGAFAGAVTVSGAKLS